jgi:hypothetical protein
MKQKDVALIILIAGISAIASYYISGKIFVPPKNRQQTVEVVSPISSTFSTPDSKYFNSKSIDPAQPLTLSSSSNTPSNANGN